MKNTFVYYTLVLGTGASVAGLDVSAGAKVALFFLLYGATFAFLEMVDMFTGVQIWSQTERTTVCYDWLHQYLKQNYGIVQGEQLFDLSESMYLGDFTTPSKKALENKYRHIFAELNLGAGKTLLDCGCGDGTWIQYCKNRGVEVVGVTLSTEQQAGCAARGLKVFAQDYRVLNKEFIAAFDAISVLGSTEHVSVMSDVGTMLEKSYRDYKAVFSLLKRYLKPEGHILLTALVQNRPKREWTLYDYVQVYIIQRHYGGYYSKPEIIRQAISDSGFTVKTVTDRTKDYHWVSIVEPDHFGHWRVLWEEDTFNKLNYFLAGVLTDPFLVHHWLYYILDSWMYHLGGYQQTPLTDEQVARSLCNLKYFLIS